MSAAVRLKVGSILVKDGNIISFGWNGMPAGWDNNCEDQVYSEDGFHITLKTKPEVLHSEANALMKVAKAGGGVADSTMYCTHAPCIECAKLIHQAGVRKLLYRNTYRNSDGLAFLERSGVEIEQFNAGTSQQG